MNKTKKAKNFGCVKCGTTFEIYPPDDMHTTASRDEAACETRGVIKMDYACKACGAINAIHWCRRRSHHDIYP